MTKHNITGARTLAGLDIGKSWSLPPTLTLQYHFTKFGAFKPYIGLGVNYTVFFSQSAANTPVAGLAVAQLNITNSFGAAAQVGGMNFEVKKLYLEPNYTAAVNSAIPVSAPRISTRGWSRAASPISSDADPPALFPAEGRERDGEWKPRSERSGARFLPRTPSDSTSCGMEAQ